MVPQITNYQEFFANAKKAVAETAAVKAEEESLREQEAKLSNDLLSEQKALKDSIELTVKKRMTEVTATYDEEIDKANEELKKVRIRREHAKTAGIKERIKEETAGLKTENINLKTGMKEAFSKQKVPSFCRTGLYYALYFPHHASEWFLFILIALVFFLALPAGIYYVAFPHRPTYVLILIYALDIVFFGGLYVLIGNSTKLKYLEMLKQGRLTTDEIRANKKKIKAITDGITKDKSEDKYNLASFDDEIAHINQQLANATMKKQEALNTFNSVTKNIITDELTGNAKPRMDLLTSEHADTVKKLQETSLLRQQKVLDLSDHYEVYLGKDFMSAERIDALAEIMGHGTASNITEAIEEFKNRTDE